MAAAKKQTKKDLEDKIAELEAKLNQLSDQLTAKPAETKPAEVKPAETKPAEVKPAETAKPKPTLPKGSTPKPKEAPKPAERPAATTKPKGTLPKGFEKPAETVKDAPKPAEKAPPASGELHERFREIPTGNWNTQKVAITGFTAPSNRYFGSRALVAQVEVTPSNWNDQKTKVTGYTAPSNKYFATKQRLAYHPEAKKFGTWINDAPAGDQAKSAPPPPQALMHKHTSTQVRPCFIIHSSFSAAKDGRKG